MRIIHVLAVAAVGLVGSVYLAELGSPWAVVVGSTSISVITYCIGWCSRAVADALDREERP